MSWNKALAELQQQMLKMQEKLTPKPTPQLLYSLDSAALIEQALGSPELAGAKIISSPLLPPGTVVALTGLNDFDLDLKSASITVDLASGESKTAFITQAIPASVFPIGGASVATSACLQLHNPAALSQCVADRLSGIGCKLLKFDVDRMQHKAELLIVIQVSMPQGGTRFCELRFDEDVLAGMHPANRYEFVANRFALELEESVSAVPDVGSFFSTSPHLQHLKAGLQRTNVSIVEEVDHLHAQKSPKYYTEAGLGPQVWAEGDSLISHDWVEKLAYRGLRAEFNKVEVWANLPLVQLRAMLVTRKMRGLPYQRKSMVIDLEHAGGLDELIPIAVYLLNERATDLIRDYTGFS